MVSLFSYDYESKVFFIFGTLVAFFINIRKLKTRYKNIKDSQMIIHRSFTEINLIIIIYRTFSAIYLQLF